MPRRTRKKRKNAAVTYVYVLCVGRWCRYRQLPLVFRWPIATCRNIANITIKKCDVLLFRSYASRSSSLPFFLYYTSGRIPRDGDDDNDAGDSSHIVVYRPECDHASFLASASDARSGKICRCKKNKNIQLDCLQTFSFFCFKIILL